MRHLFDLETDLKCHSDYKERIVKTCKEKTDKVDIMEISGEGGRIVGGLMEDIKDLETEIHMLEEQIGKEECQIASRKEEIDRVLKEKKYEDYVQECLEFLSLKDVNVEGEYSHVVIERAHRCHLEDLFWRHRSAAVVSRYYSGGEFRDPLNMFLGEVANNYLIAPYNGSWGRYNKGFSIQATKEEALASIIQIPV